MEEEENGSKGMALEDVARRAIDGDRDALEELVRGGMGVVYKALDTHLKRPVAISCYRRRE